MIQLFIFMTGFSLKTHVKCIPCSNEKIADDLPEDMTCRYLGQYKTLSHYNPFDTLPHSARNSENTDN